MNVYVTICDYTLLVSVVDLARCFHYINNHLLLE